MFSMVDEKDRERETMRAREKERERERERERESNIQITQARLVLLCLFPPSQIDVLIISSHLWRNLVFNQNVHLCFSDFEI